MADSHFLLKKNVIKFFLKFHIFLNTYAGNFLSYFLNE